MIPETMRAVVLTGPTEAADVRLCEVPVPSPKPGWVLIKVRGFGLNHSEQILRQGEIDEPYIKKPVIPGIECVGKVADPSDSGLVRGQRVAALMGGMGRSFDGSYAEYALVPADRVFAVASELSWAELAAVPETYYTAWGSLFQGLRLRAGESLLIRGATCALGYVAIQIAKALGCSVVATTHKSAKLRLLTEADEAVLDRGELARGRAWAQKALELVGAKTLPDTLRCVGPGGVVCDSGVLGGVFGLARFNPISDIPNGVWLTGFHSNWPDQATMDAIFAFLAEHDLRPKVGAVYPFDEIRDACLAQDRGAVDGKIVVTV